LFRENLAGADVVPAPAWSDALPLLTPSQDPRAAIARTMTRTMTDAEGIPLSPEDQTALRRIIIDRPSSVEEQP
jgi:hypothetical protein